MQKKNLFLKKLNKLVLSINKGLESFFNFFKDNFFNKKKRNFQTIDKRIFLALSLIFIASVSYFLAPAFYNKEKIKAQIEKQISNKYNLQVKISKPLKYGLFPKPHFSSDNVDLIYKSGTIAVSKNTKISIFTKNLFFVNNVEIKDLNFNKTDFKIKSTNFYFFVDLLNNLNNNEEIQFKKSKLFFFR